MATLMSNYAPLPLHFIKGEGAWLWDYNNMRYLDAVAGIAVCSLGHAHPQVTNAICEQAGKLLHTSNLYGIKLQQQLADKLVAISGMQNCFFCNSGAEANEAMLKLSRLYAAKRKITQPMVIVMQNSFHGRTLATLSASGNPKIQQGFAPLIDGFIFVAYNDLAAIKELAAMPNNNIVAVLVEPVQGEGGVRIPDADYLPGLRQLCTQQQWLLMLDEVQTGIGRTGKWFAYQHYGIKPDVVSSAKALGNGMPIGACLARSEAASLFTPGSHGTTFGGNPLACSASLAVLHSIEQENLLARVVELGNLLLNGLQQQLADVPGVIAVRGQGLMLGIELERPCAELVALALEQSLLINVTAGNVIRLLPPFILTNEQAEQIISILTKLITSFLARH